MRFEPAVLLLATGLALSGCLSDVPMARPISWQPAALSDGWEIASPEAVGLTAAQLDDLYARWAEPEQFHTARSLLVVRDGKLVAEGYPRGIEDRDRLRKVQSVSKSLTALLLGIAREQGLVPAPNHTFFEVMPELFDGDEKKRSIRIDHALTMRTGLDFEDWKIRDFVLGHDESILRNVLSQPLVREPGSEFHYSSGDSLLLGGMLERQTGESLDSFAAKNLYGPLGITEHKWDRFRDGVSLAHGGAWLKPRDLAKIGQLMLQRGAYAGRQVVPQAWVDECTTAHANLSHGPYGYQWWVSPDLGGFAAHGRGGQMLYVIPRQRMVVVQTADADAQWPVTVRSEDVEALIYRLIRTN